MTAWDSMRGSRYLAEDPLAHPPTQMALLLLSWCLVLSPCYLYFLRLGGHRGDIVKGRPASVGGWVRERRKNMPLIIPLVPRHLGASIAILTTVNLLFKAMEPQMLRESK